MNEPFNGITVSPLKIHYVCDKEKKMVTWKDTVQAVECDKDTKKADLENTDKGRNRKLVKNVYLELESDQIMNVIESDSLKSTARSETEIKLSSLKCKNGCSKKIQSFKSRSFSDVDMAELQNYKPVSKNCPVTTNKVNDCKENQLKNDLEEEMHSVEDILKNLKFKKCIQQKNLCLLNRYKINKPRIEESNINEMICSTEETDIGETIEYENLESKINVDDKNMQEFQQLHSLNDDCIQFEQSHDEEILGNDGSCRVVTEDMEESVWDADKSTAQTSVENIDVDKEGSFSDVDQNCLSSEHRLEFDMDNMDDNVISEIKKQILNHSKTYEDPKFVANKNEENGNDFNLNEKSSAQLEFDEREKCDEEREYLATSRFFGVSTVKENDLIDKKRRKSLGKLKEHRERNLQELYDEKGYQNNNNTLKMCSEGTDMFQKVEISNEETASLQNFLEEASNKKNHKHEELLPSKKHNLTSKFKKAIVPFRNILQDEDILLSYTRDAFFDYMLFLLPYFTYNPSMNACLDILLQNYYNADFCSHSNDPVQDHHVGCKLVEITDDMQELSGTIASVVDNDEKGELEILDELDCLTSDDQESFNDDVSQNESDHDEFEAHSCKSLDSLEVNCTETENNLDSCNVNLEIGEIMISLLDKTRFDTFPDVESIEGIAFDNCSEALSLERLQNPLRKCHSDICVFSEENDICSSQAVFNLDQLARKDEVSDDDILKMAADEFLKQNKSYSAPPVVDGVSSEEVIPEKRRKLNTDDENCNEKSSKSLKTKKIKDRKIASKFEFSSFPQSDEAVYGTSSRNTDSSNLKHFLKDDVKSPSSSNTDVDVTPRFLDVIKEILESESEDTFFSLSRKDCKRLLSTTVEKLPNIFTQNKKLQTLNSDDRLGEDEKSSKNGSSGFTLPPVKTEKYTQVSKIPKKKKAHVTLPKLQTGYLQNGYQFDPSQNVTDPQR